MEKVLRNLFWTALAVMGGAVAANQIVAWNAPPPSRRLGGGFKRYTARYGDIAYSVTGEGEPLLLLHAMWPGNSSAEWEHNFEVLGERFTVYAPDFLGWGLSDMPHHLLRAQDHIEQILHFVEDVVAPGESTPVAVIASGEACLFALLAAQKRPELFSKFVLICPGGEPPLPENSEGEEKPSHLHRLLSMPVAGATLINLLTAAPRLRAFAEQQLLFDKESVSGRFVSQMHASARRPGAAHALAVRFAGMLGVSWRQAWESLPQPMLLVWGHEAKEQGFETVPEWLALRPTADLEVFDHALKMPHFEHASDFNARILGWLNR